MTNREAIERLQRCKRNLKLGKVIGAVSEESADERIEAYDLAIKALEERPQGEWKEITKGIDSNTYECPFCGRLINCDKPRLKLYPFCHCGADMRKGSEEE